MAKCYLCKTNIKIPKHTTPDGKYMCRKCYFRQMLKKKLKFWKK